MEEAKAEAEMSPDKAIQEDKQMPEKQSNSEDAPTDNTKKEEVQVEIEPKTGISFPTKLDDGKQLNAVGLIQKGLLGVSMKIYGFGIYADNEKLKDLMQSGTGKQPTPNDEMYQRVINSDVEVMVRMVIVFPGLTMTMIRMNFDASLEASIKKLTGGENKEVPKKILTEESDKIRLRTGSVMEISRLPGYIFQMKVMDEVVSKVESELLCRAYIHMYLGDDPFDKDAKEKFGMSLISLL